LEDQMLDSEIIVSVQMLSYQHVEYIRMALDSILMQKVNFKYEIVIGDDCSTDGSQLLLLDYKKRYPDIFKLILHKKNVGTMKNVISVLKHCNGKYIAFLECDDFWTDEYKLQIQVDFLNDNKDFAACYHNTNVIGDDKKECRLYKAAHYDITSFEQYFKYIPAIPTASLIMRNFIRDSNCYQYFTKTKYIGDRIVHALILLHGKIKYIDKTMCAYRYITNGNTSFSSKNYIERQKDYLKALGVQREIAPNRCNHLISRMISNNKRKVIQRYLSDHMYKDMLKYWLWDLSMKEKVDILRSK